MEEEKFAFEASQACPASTVLYLIKVATLAARYKDPSPQVRIEHPKECTYLYLLRTHFWKRS